MTADDAFLTIRRPVPDDLTAVSIIETWSFGDPWSEIALQDELVTDTLRQPLIAELAGRVVGYLMAWRVADQLHVLNIATEAGHRRSGVATALLRTAAEMSLAAGLRTMTLEVRRSNTGARAFYIAHGFDETGVRRGYYRDDGEDAIVMDCDLETLVPDRN